MARLAAGHRMKDLRCALRLRASCLIPCLLSVLPPWPFMSPKTWQQFEELLQLEDGRSLEDMRKQSILDICEWRIDVLY
jgi:hypothetical protein